MLVELIPLQVTDESHRNYMIDSLLRCFRDDPYAAAAFPFARAEVGFLSPGSFPDNASLLILADGEPGGWLLAGREGSGTPWEISFLWIEEKLRGQGLGSRVLSQLENRVAASDCPELVSLPYSRRSVVKGIPAFAPEVLHFFTKRGYVVSPRAEGLYGVWRETFQDDRARRQRRETENLAAGYQLREIDRESRDYEELCSLTAELCRHESRDGWERFFREDTFATEREGLSVVIFKEDVVAACAYGFASHSPGIWGAGSQWGPLLTDSRHRGRGLAGWLIASSVARQFECGAQQVVLWTTVASDNSHMYEKYGFRLVCPWFAISKTCNFA
jgi:GNAT superfamily N-acetyltransferase